MSFLADACALIQFFAQPSADDAMPKAAEILRTRTVLVASTTVWEITNKVAQGKLMPIWIDHGSLTALLHAEKFEVHAMDWEDAEHAGKLPRHHKDPMDRLLIATALRNDLTVLTSDAIFARYGVKTLW